MRKSSAIPRTSCHAPREHFVAKLKSTTRYRRFGLWIWDWYFFRVGTRRAGGEFGRFGKPNKVDETEWVSPRIPIHTRAIDEADGVGLGVAAERGIVMAVPVVMQARFEPEPRSTSACRMLTNKKSGEA